MILFKKAFRSMLANKRAYLSCIALISAGIAFFVSFRQLYINLNGALNSFYQSTQFGEVFADVKGIPLSEVDKLAGIPGIRQADARITASARVVSGSGRIITLLLISYPPDERPLVNNYELAQGSEDGEGLLVGQAFLDAHGLEIGDTLTLTVGGREYDLPIDAGVLSPEYIYAVQESSSYIPDPFTYSFAYFPYPQLAAMTGKAGTADHLSFLLEEGVSYDDVKIQLEDALSPYGNLSLTEREDQSSHAMIFQEIEQLQSMASAIPLIFIVMSMIVLYIMLKRVIEQERMQIGTLKAFGYSDGQVLAHYLFYGGFTGLCGGILGCLLGIAMTGAMTDMYLAFFQLPDFSQSMSSSSLLQGILIAVLSGVAGSYLGASSILRLAPGDAMRPASPPILKRDIVKRIPLLPLLLDSGGAMAVRNISRSKFRALFVVVGVTFSYGLIAYMSSYGNMMDVMVLNQFTYVQLYDVRVTLDNPAAYSEALSAGRQIPGADHVEGLMEQPVVLKHNHLEKGVVVTAMEKDSSLYRIYDNELSLHLEPPANGLIINSTLASKLEAKRGDILYMETPYFEDDLQAVVWDIVNENTGLGCYMELGALCRLLEVPKSVTDLIIQTGRISQVQEAVIDGGNVKAVIDKQNNIRVFNDMMSSYDIMLQLMQWAGVAIAAAIIYNTSSIALSERKREYATLRVLGMHPGEIGRIAAFEYWALAFLGMVLGIPMTRLLNTLTSAMVDAEMFTLPKSVPLRCYLIAAAGCALAVFLSNRSAVRTIGRMDMVDVLKERE